MAAPVDRVPGSAAVESVPTVRPATDADAPRWNEFVDAADGAEIYHRYEWRHLLEGVFGHRCHYLLAEKDDGTIAGVLPASEISRILFGRFFVSIPYFNYCGVLAASAPARAALIDAMCDTASRAGATSVELRHRGELALDMPSRSEKVAMQLGLPDSSDALWKQFPSKLRAQIRRPQKAGAGCANGRHELLDDFYAVFARNMRDLGTPVFPKAMFSRILDLFPEAARIFVVYLDDRPTAGSLTLGYRGVLEVPVASSLREFNREAVNMLLYWSMLEYGIQNEYTIFDFGRSTRDSGPHRFKKQWGATASPLTWHYWLKDGEADAPQCFLKRCGPESRVDTPKTNIENS